MNGSIPDLTGRAYPIDGKSPAQLGFVTYGSDSGHQMGTATDWTLNDEAIRNLGYMQMKKTHDAAMVLVERMYGERPRYSYYTGTSQGGREALTVAQRYPADYDGVIANVPIALLTAWVEGREAPAMSLTVQTPDGMRTMPLCSYPTYPRYISGPASTAASYTCANR
jgi:tannase/feruloyl esterase